MLSLRLFGTSFQDPESLVAQDFLYVASQEDVTVSVIDTRSNELLETVDLKSLGFSESAKAHHTAVEPDGTQTITVGDVKVFLL